MASEEGPAVFMKRKFHTYRRRGKDLMARTLALPHFQERGKKEVLPFVSTPGIRACKIPTLKSPELPTMDDKVAVVRMPRALSFSPMNFINVFTLPTPDNRSQESILEIHLYSALGIGDRTEVTRFSISRYCTNGGM